MVQCLSLRSNFLRLLRCTRLDRWRSKPLVTLHTLFRICDSSCNGATCTLLIQPETLLLHVAYPTDTNHLSPQKERHTVLVVPESYQAYYLVPKLNLTFTTAGAALIQLHDVGLTPYRRLAEPNPQPEASVSH